MQVLHLAIAAATVALIAWRSPFVPLERWLLAFGYLFAFEYAVISRGYALGVLLLVLVCHWSSRTDKQLWWIALALCALANTSVYGTMLAICLLAALAHDWREAAAAARWRRAAAAGLIVLGCAAAVVTMKPPPD